MKTILASVLLLVFAQSAFAVGPCRARFRACASHCYDLGSRFGKAAMDRCLQSCYREFDRCRWQGRDPDRVGSLPAEGVVLACR
jgi:hypothetical protein